MTAMRAAWVICDESGCDSQHPMDLSGDTISDVEREAKALGWTRLRDGSHRCQYHCPTCGASGGTENCTTVSGRDHAARRRQVTAPRTRR